MVLVLRTIGVTAMNLEMMLGSMLTSHVSVPTWTLGLVIHLCFAALFGLAYGAIMEGIQKRGAGKLEKLFASDDMWTVK